MNFSAAVESDQLLKEAIELVRHNEVARQLSTLFEEHPVEKVRVILRSESLEIKASYWDRKEKTLCIEVEREA